MGLVRSAPRNVDSVEKLLGRLSLLSVEPISYNGTVLGGHVEHISVSPSLLGAFRCHVGCTACCLPFTLDFTPAEFARLAWASDVAEQARGVFAERVVEVNGRSVPIMSYPQYQDPACPFLRPTRPGGAQGCGFWTQNNSTQPLECAAAPQLHMEVDAPGHTVLTRRPFRSGHLWVNPAQCEFDPVGDDPGDGGRMQDTVNLLARYRHWADTFQIQTYIDQVIPVVAQLPALVKKHGLQMMQVV